MSLLNDDIYTQPQRITYRSNTSYYSSRSTSGSPNTPELLRSDSYDSQASNDPTSPLTPSVAHDYRRGYGYSSSQQGYDDYETSGMKRPSFAGSSRSNSYEDDSSASPLERPGKRYPCRYRDSHGCEKTFTTSGHASRHSKIHTAEKAVQCTFSGCQKKFTRADNMKQHLETHYKDKSRSSSHRSSAARPSTSTTHRHSSGRTTTSSGSSSKSSRDSSTWESESYSRHAALPSPGMSGAWDLRGLNLPLMSRPSAARTPSGLDALAMAVACQEGACQDGTR